MVKFMTSQEFGKWHDKARYPADKAVLNAVYDILVNSPAESDDVAVQYNALRDKDKIEITQIVREFGQPGRLNNRLESRRIRRESAGMNAGNLLIGQLIDVLVTDVAGAQYIKPMRVGEIYSDNMILVKDEIDGNVAYLQFDQFKSSQLPNGLIYTSLDDNTGLSYTLVISSNLMSNQSITSKVLESKVSRLASIIKLNS